MLRRISPPVLAFAVSAIGLVVILAAAEQTRRDMRSSVDAVNHALDAQRAFDALLKSLLDAETGQRGFLLTGSEAYLLPYYQAQQSIPSQLHALKEVTRPDEHHHRRVQELPTLVTRKMSELRDAVQLRQDGQTTAAALVNTDRGRVLMDRIRGLLDGAFREEQRLLRARQAVVDAAIRRRTLMIDAMAALVMVIGFVALRLRGRLRKLESLVTVCAWSKTVQDGDEWISFEEYLRRRYGVRVTHGLSPTEVAKLVHPPAPPTHV